MKRLSEVQYIAMTNLNMLTVITDALKHVMAQEENGIIPEDELEGMRRTCSVWLRRYHGLVTEAGDDK